MPILAFLAGNLWRTAALALAIGLSLQTLRLGWAQEARDEAIGAGAVALSANRTQEAMLTALTAQRDALLLARAQDQEAARVEVAQAQAVALDQHQKLRAALTEIQRLAAIPKCTPVMHAQICPEIERELRAP